MGAGGWILLGCVAGYLHHRSKERECKRKQSRQQERDIAIIETQQSQAVSVPVKNVEKTTAEDDSVTQLEAVVDAQAKTIFSLNCALARVKAVERERMRQKLTQQETEYRALAIQQERELDKMKARLDFAEREQKRAMREAVTARNVKAKAEADMARKKASQVDQPSPFWKAAFTLKG